MNRLFTILIFTLGAAFFALALIPGAASGTASLQGLTTENPFEMLIELARSTVTLFARLTDFVLVTAVQVYQLTPPVFHCFLGGLFLMFFLLAALGLITLRAGTGIWNRFFP